MVEHLDTLAEASAKAISNIEFDKIVVWDGGNGNASSGFFQSTAKTLPPMMHVLRDIAGVELPSYLGSIAGAGAGIELPAAVALPPDAPGVPSVAKG